MNATQKRNAADLIETAAAEFAAESIRSEQGSDVVLGAMALAAPGSDAAFADRVSAHRAIIGEASKADTFTPSEAIPTWDEYLRMAAAKRPYTVSPKTIGNLRNARRFLSAAGIDPTNATAFADAKRIVAKSAKAVETLAPAIKSDADPVARLAAEAGSKAAAEYAGAAKRDAKAEEERAKREADPIGYVLNGLLRKVDGDAAGAVTLASLLRKAAEQADRIADLAAGGSSVVDADGQPVADGDRDASAIRALPLVNA